MVALMHSLILLSIAVLPVAGLLIFIYFQDKYQKEPIKSLLKAFFGGMLAIAFDVVMVTSIEYSIGLIPFLSYTVFYDSFLTAALPEELCKFLIFMIFIWRDKNFDEYFDGIVYAAFIGLGFACVENIEYVFMYGFGVGVSRALFAVPGHFLFGVLMGYFLSLAKFTPEKRKHYIFLGLLFAIIAHGLYDWLLMFVDRLTSLDSSFGYLLAILIYPVFLAGDVLLWIFGMKLVRKHQRNSLQQSEINNETTESEFKQIDWNAGNKY
jgi:RsiW-degrading membrane proteinase PrsW (M82 family)